MRNGGESGSVMMKFQCPDCGYSNSHYRRLLNHIMMEHWGGKQLDAKRHFHIYTCWCGSRLNTVELVYSHIGGYRKLLQHFEDTKERRIIEALKR